MSPITERRPDGPGFSPRTAAGTKAFIVTPFARLARTHAVSAAADAMVVAALAGSVFFSQPAGGARTPVLRYLLLTMLPFALVSPLIGPLIDRLHSGHRYVVIGTQLVRAAFCFLMISSIKSGNTIFFLEALVFLMMQKAYQVARSALVPTVVASDDELVEANSKLALISGVMSFVGVVPSAALLKAFGPQWSVGLAMCTFVVAGLLGTRIAATKVASTPAGSTEKAELRSAGIVLAGSAMGVLRGCVGFLTLLVAFDFKGHRPAWQLGVVGGASVLSSLLGAAFAPRIRQLTSEENLLTAMLVLVVLGAVVATMVADVAGAALLGACIGFGAAAGKLAFDSILQRDAPDANRGRSFAKFETRFQVMWVVGAFIPVAIEMSVLAGVLLVLGVTLAALFFYVVGRLAWAHRSGERVNAATAAAVEIEGRFADVSGEVKGRLRRTTRGALRRVVPGHRGEPSPADGPEPAATTDAGADLDVPEGGWSAAELAGVGWTPTLLLQSGWTPDDLAAAGWPPAEVAAAVAAAVAAPVPP
ncbi:MAG: Major Facilitator Superfamily transporter, partial [Acidimicrobiales bacterium]|nr:Major Facilitator Superfamily transporter [Acidimicrobiales bacterium]